MFKHIIYAFVLTAGAFFALAVSAAANTPDPASDHAQFVAYRVVKGDTLSSIADKYLSAGADVRKLAKLNALSSASHIRPQQNLWLPRRWVKFSLVDGAINAIECSAGSSKETPDGSLKVGQKFTEAQTLVVPKPCHVGLSLPDNTTIRLAPGSTLTFSLLRKYAGESQHMVRLDLVEGSIFTHADHRIKRFVPLEVKTPLAMTGVRGTEFRLGYSVSEGLSRLEVPKGTVLSQGKSDAAPIAVASGFGVVVNASGESTGLEKLLGASGFKEVQRGASPDAPLTVVLMPVEGAARYRVKNTSGISVFGGSDEKIQTETRIEGERLLPTATVYQVVAEAASGLQGAAADFALCAPADAAKSPVCAVTFDLPDLASGQAKFFLNMTSGPDVTPVISGNLLPATTERFVVRGLRPGIYEWRLDYGTTGSHEGPRSGLSGSFSVHALGPL